MEIFFAVGFAALIIALWAFVVIRFRLRWWTILFTLLLLAVLFAVFFRPEDEETDGEAPQSAVAADRAPA